MLTKSGHTWLSNILKLISQLPLFLTWHHSTMFDSEQLTIHRRLHQGTKQTNTGGGGGLV